jgi:hypothetical protein
MTPVVWSSPGGSSIGSVSQAVKSDREIRRRSRYLYMTG